MNGTEEKSRPAGAIGEPKKRGNRLLYRQGSTALNLNPMMASGTGQKAMIELSEEELGADNMPSEVPPDAVYLRYVERFKEMEERLTSHLATKKKAAASAHLTSLRAGPMANKIGRNPRFRPRAKQFGSPSSGSRSPRKPTPVPAQEDAGAGVGPK